MCSHLGVHILIQKEWGKVPGRLWNLVAYYSHYLAIGPLLKFWSWQSIWISHCIGGGLQKWDFLLLHVHFRIQHNFRQGCCFKSVIGWRNKLRVWIGHNRNWFESIFEWIKISDPKWTSLILKLIKYFFSIKVCCISFRHNYKHNLLLFTKKKQCRFTYL